MISGVSSLTKSATTFADIKSAKMTQPSYEAFQKMFFEWYLHFNWCLYFCILMFFESVSKAFCLWTHFFVFWIWKSFCFGVCTKILFCQHKMKESPHYLRETWIFKGISKVPKVVLASFAKVIVYINSNSLCLRLGKRAVIPCRSRITQSIK